MDNLNNLSNYLASLLFSLKSLFSTFSIKHHFLHQFIIQSCRITTAKTYPTHAIISKQIQFKLTADTNLTIFKVMIIEMVK